MIAGLSDRAVRHVQQREGLTPRQQQIFELIDNYVRVTGEPCSANFLARRTGAHHSTIREHLSALHRKGWLVGSDSPVLPRQR
jgi:DNA-binding IclR family transcriptional regulator